MRDNYVDILGIGAQKSATSWAAHVLNLQANVWIPRDHALSGKEVMFWDRYYARGLPWYQQIMTPPTDTQKSMDVSPGYSRVGPGKIAECKRTSPSARVFFLMRNPIYRDWSSLLMEATLRDKLDVANASFVDLMVYYDRHDIQQFTTYAKTIRQWREKFGEQFFVGIYDDISNDPHGFYQRLCAHCGLEPDAVPEWRTRIAKRVFKGPDIALPPQMHEFLLKKYTPMIKELEELTGRDLSDWTSADPQTK